LLSENIIEEMFDEVLAESVDGITTIEGDNYNILFLSSIK